MNARLRTMAVVLVAVAALAGLDQFLARVEMQEVHSAADRSWHNGIRLLNDRRAVEALDALRNAHSLERDNLSYELDMIAALTALGRFGEADSLMDEVLQRRPNGGAENLTAARLLAKEGKSNAAEAYYHRAIYGEWAGGSPASRQATRFELVQLLARGHNRQQLLAELISLEVDAGDDAEALRRVAEYFLKADSPARAAAVYRDLIAKNPEDAEAYEGLGEAELQAGNYRPARAAFLQASWHHQGILAAPRLVLLNEVIQLDPTSRHLPTAEKYERSVRILALAKGDLEAHVERQPAPARQETTALLKAAGAPASKQMNDAAEQNLDLAEKVWKVRLASFGPSMSPDEEPLRLVMARLGS